MRSAGPGPDTRLAGLRAVPRMTPYGTHAMSQGVKMLDFDHPLFQLVQQGRRTGAALRRTGTARTPASQQRADAAA